METDRLRQFCTIAETLNFRKAAELLGITPGGLSKSMQTFERELGGTQLFVPEGRGIGISEQGQKLYVLGQKFLGDYEALLNELQKRDTVRPVRIGSFEVFTTYFMGACLSHYLKETPVHLVELTPGKIEEALLNQEVDFGITYAPIPRPGLEFIRVGEFGSGIFGRKGVFSKLPFEEIPFAVPTSSVFGTPSAVEGLDGWPYRKIPRKVLYRFEMLESALEVARQGLAALYCPTPLIELHNQMLKESYQLVKYPLPPKMKSARQPVYIVKRKADPESRHFQAVARALRKTFNV